MIKLTRIDVSGDANDERKWPVLVNPAHIITVAQGATCAIVELPTGKIWVTEDLDEIKRKISQEAYTLADVVKAIDGIGAR